MNLSRIVYSKILIRRQKCIKLVNVIRHFLFFSIFRFLDFFTNYVAILLKVRFLLFQEISKILACNFKINAIINKPALFESYASDIYISKKSHFSHEKFNFVIFEILDEGS